MPHQQLINRDAREPLVVLRKSYLAICDNDHCAAVLLSTLEFWTMSIAGRAQLGEEPDTRPLWIYRSVNELSDDLLGMFGRYSVQKGLNILLEKGFISRRNNPDVPYDRKYQYLLEIDKIQDAIDSYYSIERIPQIKRQNSAVQSEENGRAIQENLKENLLEDHGVYTPPSEKQSEIISHGKREEEIKVVNGNKTDGFTALERLIMTTCGATKLTLPMVEKLNREYEHYNGHEVVKYRPNVFYEQDTNYRDWIQRIVIPDIRNKTRQDYNVSRNRLIVSITNFDKYNAWLVRMDRVADRQRAADDPERYM